MRSQHMSICNWCALQIALMERPFHSDKPVTLKSGRISLEQRPIRLHQRPMVDITCASCSDRLIMCVLETMNLIHLTLELYMLMCAHLNDLTQLKTIARDVGGSRRTCQLKTTLAIINITGDQSNLGKSNAATRTQTVTFNGTSTNKFPWFT